MALPSHDLPLALPADDEPLPAVERAPAAPAPGGRSSQALELAFGLIAVTVLALSVYANLSYLVTDRASYRYFPPFEAGVNRNMNEHLGAEYYCIGTALAKGRGFADPFRVPTGPTAWMPPVLPALLAGLHTVTGGDVESITALFILLQDLTLILTGALVLALVRRSGGPVWLAAGLFVVALLYTFRLSFQFTHDCWLIMLALDAVVAGLVWGRPLAGSYKRAAAWGALGGLCALSSPIVGFTWGVLSLTTGAGRGRRGPLAVALLAAGLTVAPWVVRNLVVFGKFIPVKANLAYELYQSQCLTRDGVLVSNCFGSHPWCNNGEERRLYRKLGEPAYLAQKKELFLNAVAADPLDFVERVVNRFIAATIWYRPFDPGEAHRSPRWVSIDRQVHPLPFVAVLVLLATAWWRPLAAEQWVVIGAYAVYLAPYVVVSYYERYKYPLLPVELALIVWAAVRLNPGWWRAEPPTSDTESLPEAEPA